MSSLIPSGSATGTGAVTLIPTSSNNNQTITLPDATGVAMVSGNMPAFSYYSSSAQNPSSGTYTKVIFGTQVFDTSNSVSSSRFTPTVAGYYQISACVAMAADISLTSCSLLIYKNGSQTISNIGTDYNGIATAGYVTPSISGLIYLNGSTDYIEIYGQATGTGTNRYFFASAVNHPTVFTGVLVRAA